MEAMKKRKDRRKANIRMSSSQHKEGGIAMLKKLVVSVITVLLIAIALVGGAKSAGHQGGPFAEESFDPAQVAKAETARWIAKGEFYGGLYDPALAVEAEAARWIAKGEFYARLAETQRERAIAADVARWIAKGEFYTGLDGKTLAVETEAAP
jgi:hypothetical protein